MEPDGDKSCTQEKRKKSGLLNFGRKNVCVCLHIFVVSIEQKIVFLYTF